MKAGSLFAAAEHTVAAIVGAKFRPNSPRGFSPLTRGFRPEKQRFDKYEQILRTSSNF
jgi:hypothetical protein